MTVIDIFIDGIYHINFVKIYFMKYFFKVKENVLKNDGKVWVGKIKTKSFLCRFFNARKILELMLCKRNLTKLLYQTLLISDYRALALKLSEYLKKKFTFSIKIRLKRTIIRSRSEQTPGSVFHPSDKIGKKLLWFSGTFLVLYKSWS